MKRPFQSILFICIITIVLISSGCRAQPAAPVSPTIPPTATSTPTAAFTSTTTPTITLTPTSTSTPTTTPDLEDVGEPQFPFTIDYRQPCKLSYDDIHYDVEQKKMHNRLMTVAWEKDAPRTPEEQTDVNQFFFDTYLHWWEIFHGFPYKTYTVVLTTKNFSTDVTHACANGYSDVSDHYTNEAEYGDNWREHMAHEMFHVWLGWTIYFEKDKKYDDARWFYEGITSYYGYRGSGEDSYFNWMIYEWKTYSDDILYTEVDVPLTELPTKAQGEKETSWNFGAYRQAVYTKGALVGYLMDQKLHEQGYSLNGFLHQLYLDYGLKKQPLKVSKLLKEINKYTGQDWQEFFDNYIYGTEPLPLTSDGFIYIPD